MFLIRLSGRRFPALLVAASLVIGISPDLVRAQTPIPGQNAASVRATQRGPTVTQLSGPEAGTTTAVGGPIQQALACTACHTTPPSVIGLDDPPTLGFDAPELSTRSWAAWWEVNRLPFLLKARTSRPDPIDSPIASDSIVNALMDAARSGAPEVRREAVLSLGRVGAQQSLDLLKDLTPDSDRVCALRAWAAIGLLDSPAAMQFLAAAPANGLDRVGWTLAVGLSRKPTDAMWKIIRVQSEETGRSPEARRLAVWALRVHHVPDTHDLFKRIISQSTDAFVVTEAMGALAIDARPQDVQDLITVALHTNQASSLALFASARARTPLLARGAILPDAFNPEMNTGSITTLPAFLIHDAAFRALADVPSISPDDYDSLYSPMEVPSLNQTQPYYHPTATAGFSPQDVIPLAEKGSLADSYVISDRLEVNMLPHDGTAPPDQRAYRPGRGLSAVALGVLLDHLGGGKQESGEVVTSNRTHLDQRAMRNARSGNIVIMTDTYNNLRSAPDESLILNLKKTTDPAEFRAACALALGIGRQKHRIDDLKGIVDSLGPGDEPVFGYSMLALGILGDRDVMQYCQRELAASPKSQAVSMNLSEVMARRAAVQGLAVLGDPQAIPLLADQWGKNPALDVEVARAIAWCSRGSHSTSSDADPAVTFGNTLTRTLRENKSPQLSASAAASIGVLFDHGAAQRLDQIISGQSFRARGQRLEENGQLRLSSLQRQILALGNPHYYLTAFAAAPAK